MLSGGRLNVGVSVGPPPFSHLIADYVDDAPQADYSHGRAEKLARALQSHSLSERQESGNAAGTQIPRLRPIAKSLSDRLWYGGGSQNSARWASRTGFNLLTGNIVSGEDTDDFLTAQAALITRFRHEWAHTGPARVALGRVILLTGNASAATRKRYVDFVASRTERTKNAHGPRRTLFLPDIIGTRADILEQLSRDPVVPLVSGFRLELPSEFQPEGYAQAITDFAELFPASVNSSFSLLSAS